MIIIFDSIISNMCTAAYDNISRLLCIPSQFWPFNNTYHWDASVCMCICVKTITTETHNSQSLIRWRTYRIFDGEFTKIHLNVVYKKNCCNCIVNKPSQLNKKQNTILRFVSFKLTLQIYRRIPIDAIVETNNNILNRSQSILSHNRMNSCCSFIVWIVVYTNLTYITHCYT